MYKFFLACILVASLSGCTSYNQMTLIKKQGIQTLKNEAVVLLVVETSWKTERSKKRRSIPAIQSIVIQDSYGIKKSYKVGKESSYCKDDTVKQVISLSLNKGSHTITEFSGAGLMCTEGKGKWYTTPSGKFTQQVNILLDAAPGEIRYAGHMTNYLSKQKNSIDLTPDQVAAEQTTAKTKSKRNKLYSNRYEYTISDKYHEDMALINTQFPKIANFDVINTLYRQRADDVFDAEFNE